MVQQVNERFTAASKGLITEGNELAAPRDSTLDETNYERLADITARRRRPIVEEIANRANYLPVDSTLGGATPLLDTSNRYTSSFIWKTPAHRENVSILVEEVGGSIRFYRLDHDITDDGAKRYMRKLPFDDEILLALWGRSATTDVAINDRRACTYAEGDGSLYIFSNHAGTIRVDLVGDNNDRSVAALQFTPIGTWIRDYTGAAESSAGNHRFNGSDPTTNPGNLFNGINIESPAIDLVFITDELPNDRAYNLTNTGWPEANIAQFKEQSDEPYRVYSQSRIKGSVLDTDTGRWYVEKQRNTYQYPSLQDRYLDGRTINEDGQNLFSFQMINEAQERTSEPTQGGRVGSSDYHPAGTLQPMPVDHLAPQEGNSSQTNTVTCELLPTGELEFTVGFNRAQFHSFGRENANLAVFVHQCVFTVTVPDENGVPVNRVGGFSGVFNAEKIGGLGLNGYFTLRFRHDLGAVGDLAGATGQGQSDPLFSTATGGNGSFWAHPAPIHTPHRLPDNGESFDYRNEKRPTAGAFFANRLWQFADEHDRLYYSQLVSGGNNRTRSSSLARESLCYTSASPTDGEDSQVVATDGGYVYLPNSGTHLGGVVLGQVLYVFTDTGIYMVQPGGAGFFLPTDFRISKIIDAEVLGQKAWAIAGNSIHVATDQGVLKIDEEGITNLTTQSIRSKYVELTKADRDVEVIAAFEPETQTVRWVFSQRLRSQTPGGSVLGNSDMDFQLKREHTTMLSFSERHQHWYQYDLSNGGVITDMLVLPYTVRTETYNRFRYLCTTLGEATAPPVTQWGVELLWDENGTDDWVEGSPTGFRDYRDTGWAGQLTVQGFMLTNHQLLGDGIFFNQIHYLVAHNRNVTTHLIDDGNGLYSPNIDGSTLCSVQWDWSDQEGWGKFTSPQETYRFRRSFITAATAAIEEERRGEPVLVAKIKIRGRGREFRILWQTQDDKDSHLIGWNIIGTIIPQA